MKTILTANPIVTLSKVISLFFRFHLIIKHFHSYGWQFLFECRVCVVSTHKYSTISTIWVNTNPTHLLNRFKFLNSNTTCLLNRLVVLTCLSDFVKVKKKYINTNFSRQKCTFSPYILGIFSFWSLI